MQLSITAFDGIIPYRPSKLGLSTTVTGGPLYLTAANVEIYQGTDYVGGWAYPAAKNRLVDVGQYESVTIVAPLGGFISGPNMRILAIDSNSGDVVAASGTSEFAKLRIALISGTPFEELESGGFQAGGLFTIAESIDNAFSFSVPSTASFNYCTIAKIGSAAVQTLAIPAGPDSLSVSSSLLATIEPATGKAVFLEAADDGMLALRLPSDPKRWLAIGAPTIAFKVGAGPNQKYAKKAIPFAITLWNNSNAAMELYYLGMSGTRAQTLTFGITDAYISLAATVFGAPVSQANS